MSETKRVIAALSGGVDSAVAASRAVSAGHEVVGVHLALAKVGHHAGSRGCCSPDDARDARRVADILDIPFYVWDMHEEFERDVMGDFISEYEKGNTPNPCLRCNEKIKFAAVLERAWALGFDEVCTGHYAQIVSGANGPQLHRAVDPDKDQSYVLGVLTANQLGGAMFPLGDTTKGEVREEARRNGLLVADKPDSHDICFIPDGDTPAWLHERLGTSPGNIVDAVTGEQMGAHEGAYAYTIGQRRGLDLRTPAAPGERRYVVAKDMQTNTVLVGTAELLGVRYLVGHGPRWCGPALSGTFHGLAQVRAHGEPVPASAWLDGDVLHVDLHDPIRGVATGQAVVLYDGTRVVGSATIRATDSAPAATLRR